jgi:hypothetical protein
VCICLADLSLDGRQIVGEDVAISRDVMIAIEIVLLVIGSRCTGYHLRMQVGGQVKQAQQAHYVSNGETSTSGRSSSVRTGKSG